MKNSLLLLISLLFTTNSTFASYDGGDYYEDEVYTVVEKRTVCSDRNGKKRLIVTEISSNYTKESFYSEISFDGRALENIYYNLEYKTFIDPFTGLERKGYTLKLEHKAHDNYSKLTVIASNLDAHIYNPSYMDYRFVGTLSVLSVYKDEKIEITCDIDSEDREGTNTELTILFEDFYYDSK
ncbi:hypothetical protein [Halobacteriovorax sp. DPLXC-1]|uniref:hypothetical protein n=1 Tax=Halobacteriovorax sp. DPLXC-1 TaxID=3110771 RepID=UPI002FEE9051